MSKKINYSKPERVVELPGGFKVKCFSYSRPSGFSHAAVLYDGEKRTDFMVKCHYYNRTWEAERFDSVVSAFNSKYKALPCGAIVTAQAPLDVVVYESEAGREYLKKLTDEQYTNATEFKKFRTGAQAAVMNLDSGAILLKSYNTIIGVRTASGYYVRFAVYSSTSAKHWGRFVGGDY